MKLVRVECRAPRRLARCRACGQRSGHLLPARHGSLGSLHRLWFSPLRGRQKCGGMSVATLKHNRERLSGVDSVHRETSQLNTMCETALELRCGDSEREALGRQPLLPLECGLQCSNACAHRLGERCHHDNLCDGIGCTGSELSVGAQPFGDRFEARDGFTLHLELGRNELCRAQECSHFLLILTDVCAAPHFKGMKQPVRHSAAASLQSFPLKGRAREPVETSLHRSLQIRLCLNHLAPCAVDLRQHATRSCFFRLSRAGTLDLPHSCGLRQSRTRLHEQKLILSLLARIKVLQLCEEYTWHRRAVGIRLECGPLLVKGFLLCMDPR
mmetsp:Transcript_30166/g.49950  ORF Transcript_30166/g.49950 Transcript_30166/m.49950 type:complete len:328 (-) Transcript_30166:2285-3268(-)